MKDVLKYIHERQWLRSGLIALIIGLGAMSIYSQYLRTVELVRIEDKSEQVTAKLAGEDYIEAKKLYTDLVAETSPRKALQAFNQDLENNDALLNSCHPIVHEIGHSAYDSIGFAAAIAQFNEVCNSGYIHGVIEQHFASLEDVEEGFKKTCADYDATKFLGWQCYHGLGHGAMFFTNNNLPRSLELCGDFSEEPKMIACTNGVYMENYLVDGEVHMSDYVNPLEPLFPCNEEFIAFNRSDCYVYAPTYYLAVYPGQYKELYEECERAGAYNLACTQGIGSEAMKLNLSDPSVAEAICLTAENNSYFRSCSLGALNLYAFHHGGTSELKELCVSLTDKTATICNSVVEELKDFFERP